jgi:hypothetical protein
MRLRWNLPFRLLNHCLGILTGDGSWRLNEFEKKMIQTAARTMLESDQLILTNQLKRRFYVQRLHNNRMNDIYPYDPEDWPRMDHPEEHNIATLLVSSESGSTRVYVESFTGLIRAVRCKKPPKPIIALPYKIKLISTGGQANNDIAREINDSEHTDLE